MALMHYCVDTYVCHAHSTRQYVTKLAEDVMTLADIPLCQVCGEYLMLIAHDNLFVWQPDYMREETSQP